MTAKFEIVLEFDPADRAEIVLAAQKVYRERADPHDEEENQPRDIDTALVELLYAAIDEHEVLAEVATLCEVHWDEPAMEEATQ